MVLGAIALGSCSPTPDSQPMQAQNAGAQNAGAQSGKDQSQDSEPLAQAVMSSRVHPSGTGLEIAGPGAQNLSFGQERAVVEQAVVSRMGEPVSRLANQECGAGPMQFTSFAGGLTLNFQNGAFAGWALERSEEDKGFATARGIGVGSQEAALKAAYAVERIEGSTLGDEFTSAGGINGFLSDRGGGKQVESLYAGTNCLFR